jgi:hypothetical protein
MVYNSTLRNGGQTRHNSYRNPDAWIIPQDAWSSRFLASAMEDCCITVHASSFTLASITGTRATITKMHRVWHPELTPSLYGRILLAQFIRRETRTSVSQAQDP